MLLREVLKLLRIKCILLYPEPNANILVRIVDVGTSANSTGVVIDLSSKLIDDGDGTFSVGSPTGWIKMSPQSQPLLTFSPHNANDTVYFGRSANDETNANIVRRISSTENVFSNGVLSLPEHGTLNSREVHRIRGSGVMSDSFTPEFQQIRLRVPTDYEVATTGSTTGTLARIPSTNVPYRISGITGPLMFLDDNSELATVFNGRMDVRISPNANGFPNTIVRGRQVGFLRPDDSSIFQPTNNIYIVSDLNADVITFDLQGTGFGTLQDTRNVTQDDITLEPRISATTFLDRLGAAIIAEWTTLTIAQPARVVPTDSTLAEIIIDTNQQDPIVIDFDINREPDASDAIITRAGVTRGSSF